MFISMNHALGNHFVSRRLLLHRHLVASATTMFLCPGIQSKIITAKQTLEASKKRYSQAPQIALKRGGIFGVMTTRLALISLLHQVNALVDTVSKNAPRGLVQCSCLQVNKRLTQSGDIQSIFWIHLFLGLDFRAKMEKQYCIRISYDRDLILYYIQLLSHSNKAVFLSSRIRCINFSLSLLSKHVACNCLVKVIKCEGGCFLFFTRCVLFLL